MGRVFKNKPDLDGCVNSEQLAQLFDDAFGEWRVGAANPGERRETPRVPIGQRRGHQASPIFVVGYAFNGYESDLNVRAPILDISADGLGIRLPRPAPVGAILCFAFENASAGLSYDVAQVMRCEGGEGGFRVGLAFVESARSLDHDTETDDPVTQQPADSPSRSLDPVLATAARIADSARQAMMRAGERLSLQPAAPLPSWGVGAVIQWYRRLADRVGRCCGAVRRAIGSARTARGQLDYVRCGRRAVFVVKVKPFRYQTLLLADGRRVASHSGALKNRLGSVVSTSAAPTVVHLQAGGFSGWASLRPGRIVDCGLNLCVEINQAMRRCPEVSAEQSGEDAGAHAAAAPAQPCLA